ncbi:plasmid transfer protein, partial [Escherichia coli]|nr:plasmid transfer protein [Escherichia coli]EIV9357361.1 plasmid transfer protein [Escherichia coli]
TLKKEYLGSYAPKVELIGNARKVTITWHQFSPYKNRPPSHMSKRISPMKSGKYTKSCFVNHASWEYEMIEKTEGLLEPYRELLEFYHAAYIELGRKVRQYSKSEVAQ